MGKSNLVQVSDPTLTTEQVIARSIEGGGNREHNRHHLQFGDEVPGYYTEEQIEQKLQQLRPCTTEPCLASN